VVLIDRRAAPEDRIGETLPGAARRLLTDLGLWADFLGDGHAPIHARRSVWGDERPVELDSLVDPDGPGWRLDRRRFEARLREAARARGALLLVPARVEACSHDAGGWTIRVGAPQAASVRARLLIDAGGRSSRLLRPFGARRVAEDRLACAWTHLPLRRHAASITYVESEADGWWYTAPLPDGRRLLAFHSDADLPAMADLAGAGLIERALRLDGLANVLGDADTGRAGRIRRCAAHGARLPRAADDLWLAAGDAAIAFDPLSSQGIFNALYTGLAAGRAAMRLLAGEGEAAPDYEANLDRIWAAYRRHRALYYGEERRWPDHPFWRRRLEAADDPQRAA
jgi:flavin-dependent dehydrogenase